MRVKPPPGSALHSTLKKKQRDILADSTNLARGKKWFLAETDECRGYRLGQCTVMNSLPIDAQPSDEDVIKMSAALKKKNATERKKREREKKKRTHLALNLP